jgi:hypothetical protein
MQPSSTASLKPHQTTLIVVALISLLLWIVPGFGFILLPLQYLNTHLHEWCHAFMAMITSGEVRDIKVFANGSGTTIASGSAILVSSAGYIGATIIGGLMIWCSRSERGAAVTLRTLSVLLAFSFIFWIRGDAVGVVSGLVWMIALFGLPFLVKGRQLVFVGQLLGMQQCLAAVQALYILLKISAFSNVHSDAANMASLTAIPAIVWALLWGATGLGVLYVTLRATWTGRRPA